MKRTILITGGARGIGASIAKHLAKSDFNVHVVYNRSALEFKKLRDELSALGIQISDTRGDIRMPDDCKKIIDDCIAQHGQLWGLILNAGIFIPDDPVGISIDDWKSLIDTNLSSAVYLLKWALPPIRESHGSIVFIGTGSIADSTPAPDYPLYAASKAGLYVLMRSLAVSEGKFGVRVNMVSPGMIDAGNYSEKLIVEYEAGIPLGRMGNPRDIASAVGFLLSDEASYISGANIDISGSWTR